MKTAQALLCLAAVAPGAMAWGAMGHEAIAYIATDFLGPEALKFCQTILADDSADALANVATWADSYRYTSAGKFSEPFHFIDALDSPPSSCSVSYERDCPEGNCVVGAIANYTGTVAKAVGATGSISADTLDALKFVIHFLGDVHQPLHDENLELGGNDIAVTYGSTKTNLHHAWDTNMPEDYTGGGTLADARTFATELSAAIRTGAYASAAAGWLAGIDVEAAQASAMGWASDANAYVCSTVLAGGVSAVSGQDLSGAYYDKALPVIKIQFAKAGFRLAAWLNLLVTGSTGHSGPESTSSTISPSSSSKSVSHSTKTVKHAAHTTAHHGSVNA